MTPNSGRSAKAAVSATTVSAAASVSAARTGTTPDAIGRRHLTGCRRSASRSATSLIRYTTPDSAQKITNAASASTTDGRCVSRWPNSSARSTTRFLVHCDGRRETSSPRIIEPLGGSTPAGDRVGSRDPADGVG